MWLHLIYYIQWDLVRPRAMRVIRFRTSCNIMNKVCNNFVDSLYSCCSSLFINIVSWRFSFKIHAKLNILLQSHNIVYQYFTTCNKFSHISLLFVSKKMFHSDIERTYFWVAGEQLLGCWRTGHGDPVLLRLARQISVGRWSPCPVLQQEARLFSPLQRGRGSCRTGHRDSVLLTKATKRARPRVEEAVPKDYHNRYVYMVISWMPDVDLSQLTMVEILLSAFKPFVTAVTK